MPKLSKALLSVTPLLLAGLAYGQPGDGLRWYRVELMVFSHEGGDIGSEQWEAAPELHYPDQFRFLIEPDRVKTNQAENPGESTLDEYGRQLIVLPDPAGNINRSSFREIWEHSTHLQQIRSIRRSDLLICSTCSKLPYCGRCNAQALVEDGNILGPSSAACAYAEALEDAARRGA